MNTSILDEQSDGISPDIQHRAWDEAVDLTQQEIEAGLNTLRLTLLGKRLPLIVLVEDEDEDANFFRKALREVSIAVEFMHFRDGRQAIDFFGGNGCFADREKFPLPQLTVLDLNLTRASGLEILKKIRTKPHSEQLVVVALTASEDVRDIEYARSLEIDGWVNKPHHASDLVIIVRWLLRTWLPSAF